MPINVGSHPGLSWTKMPRLTVINAISRCSIVGWSACSTSPSRLCELLSSLVQDDCHALDRAENGTLRPQERETPESFYTLKQYRVFLWVEYEAGRFVKAYTYR